MKTVCVLTVFFLLGLYAAAADTNRDNEITTNVTNLIINVSGGQVIIEPDLNLTSGFYWGGLTGFLNNDSVLWSNVSNLGGRVVVLESRPLMPNIDAANITTGVIDAARLPDNTPFYNNVTGNISELWLNASNQDGRVIALEGVKTTYETPKNCPAGQFMNGTNTTHIDCGVIAVGASYNESAVNSSIDKYADNYVKITGSIMTGNLKTPRLNVTTQIIIGDTNYFSSYGNDAIIIKKSTPYEAPISIWNTHNTGVSGVQFYNLSGAWIGMFGFDMSTKKITYQTQTGTQNYFASDVHNFAGQIYTTSNKAYNLGQTNPSFDSAYADDWVNTFRVVPSLAKNNAKDFDIKTTAINESKSDGISVLRIDVADKKVGENAKIYGSYLDVLKDIPFNESTGETDIRNIPMMLRDKWYNQDSLSTAAYLNTLRGSVIELEKENKALKARLDKLENVKN